MGGSPAVLGAGGGDAPGARGGDGAGAAAPAQPRLAKGRPVRRLRVRPAGQRQPLPRVRGGRGAGRRGGGMRRRWTASAFLASVAACAAGAALQDDPSRTLGRHGGSVLSVAFRPDGKTLASGARDDLVKLWDVAGGGAERTRRGHVDDVYAVPFSPDGTVLATASADQTVRLWDVRTDNLIRTLEGHREVVRSVRFSPDGRSLCSGG